MVKAYIGIGSNKGNRKKNICRALELLQKSGQKIVGVASIYETAPYGYKKQNKFLNTAAIIETSVSPEKLLEIAKNIEKDIGRRNTFRWGPREIDIDILFYGRRIVRQRDLIIPHKDLHNRLFVLIPLAEISPQFVHPVLKIKIMEILKNIWSKNE